MKVLVCGNDSRAAAIAEAAVYDAGCMPVGPVGNALRALGLADQELPAVAIIDLAAIDGGTGAWLAEKLGERAVDIICISDGTPDRRLASRRHTSVPRPAERGCARRMPAGVRAAPRATETAGAGRGRRGGRAAQADGPRRAQRAVVPGGFSPRSFGSGFVCCGTAFEGLSRCCSGVVGLSVPLCACSAGSSRSSGATWKKMESAMPQATNASARAATRMTRTRRPLRPCFAFSGIDLFHHVLCL